MFLYLIENSINKITYIGLTDNICRRLEEHNRKNKHFTGKMKGVWKIAGFKVIDDLNLARKEEIRLKKSKNKKYIKWYFTNESL